MLEKLKEARGLVDSLSPARERRLGRWRELSRWICPYRGQFDDAEREGRELIRFTHAATRSLLRGASGMTSGMTPRNISWFKPVFSDEAMMEAPGARHWLDMLDMAMKDCLAAGGFYQAIQTFNIDLLWGGCAMLYCEKGESWPLRFECLQTGSYLVGLDHEGRLETVARALSMTPRGMAARFGEDKLSRPCREKLKKAPYEPQKVWHLTRPRAARRPGAMDAAGMACESLYWEDGPGEDFLRVSGFHEMPFFFTCWHGGQNPYGSGPGDEALADARQMDILERRKLEGLGKLVEPPVQANSALRGKLDLSPGAINFTERKDDVAPILDLSPYARAIGYLREETAVVAQRLEQTLMADIFSSLPLEQRPAVMSATEFLERKREALQQLGPVISAYEPNVLTPLLYRVASTLDREGLLPPPPEALAGYPLIMKMDFISPMTNALRQTGAETVRALIADVGAIIQSTQYTDILDKVDFDQVVDELATGLGVPGSIVRADADVAALREQRAGQQARMEQMQARALNAQTAQNEAAAARDMAQAASAGE